MGFRDLRCGPNLPSQANMTRREPISLIPLERNSLTPLSPNFDPLYNTTQLGQHAAGIRCVEYSDEGETKFACLVGIHVHVCGFPVFCMFDFSQRRTTT